MDSRDAAIAGHVYIVGAGPGDPGLITVKGARLLAAADVVLYDDLLDTRLLDLTGPTCVRVYAGHRGGSRPDTRSRQDEVNDRLIAEARAGRCVVRLKGGDPYIFGRGGEEAIALRNAGIRFEVVSGVSAASGVLNYAGIPLTHRNVAATATLVTGHESPRLGEQGVDWAALARLGGTLVIFMGSRRLSAITEALIAGGRTAITPAAAIQWGTWPGQRSVVANLETLAQQATESGIESPALIVVGETINLRDTLNWFESKPLFGRQVLVTRSREQSGPLRLLLESQGAEVHTLPLLEISAPDDWSIVDAALARLPEFAWVAFTSPNSVRFLFDRLRQLRRDARAFGAVRIAAVGQSTAQYLRDRGIEPDLLPEKQSAAGLAQAFQEVDLCDSEILLPASAIGRTELDEKLAQQGARVMRITAYENRPPDPDTVELPAALTEQRLDCAVFASPSSAHNFLATIGTEPGLAYLHNVAIAAIGPTTARAIEELGLPVAIQPDDSSIEALVQSLCDHYAHL
jgi:uroporphyrinogen III methyltransferase / synthase